MHSLSDRLHLFFTFLARFNVMPDQLGARLSGRCLVASSRISISVMIQSEASRPLERNPCCPAARPWILINVLLTCDEAIQPVFRFHLASEIIIFGRAPSTPLENIIFGTNGKIVHSYLQEGGMPACILLILRFHFGKSSINLFSQSDYIKGVFMTTSVTTVALNHFVVHRHQRSPGQLREHSRELWVKTQKSACRLIDLL